VFLPGQASHPLRSWRIHNYTNNLLADRFLYKVWINEYLLPDLEESFKDLKPRIICTGYETKTNKALLDYFNIKDKEPFEVANELD
jgi:hypothetical protein